MKKLRLEVTGMRCDGCADAVRSALAGVEHVRRVDVSLDGGHAEVVGDDGLSPDELAAAVEAAGYEVSAPA